MTTKPPLALYIHYPWCVKKCPYCDFNSHEIKQFKQNYIEVLLADLDNDLSYVQGRYLQSIFIGGGTPSLLSVAEVRQLLDGIAQKINFSNAIEITLEANPATAEANKFSGFRQVGVNRLSIGVQSFSNQHLQQLGRAHNGNEAKSAILMAKSAGFNNFNIDLMYGLEQQTQAQARSDLAIAIDFSPSHISHYQLTIEPNTYFAKYPPNLPDTHKIYQIEQVTKSLLQQSNYLQYEVSAYAKTPSKHNLNYWQFGDYLGIGAGAHSKITLANGIIIRGIKPKSPKDYLHHCQGKFTAISPKDLVFEFMLNALRLKQGFPQDLFTKTTGLPINTLEKPLNKAITLGLLTKRDTWIMPSKKGFAFLNDLQIMFLPS